MILRMISRQLEKKAGRKLHKVTLRMHPKTYVIDGTFTDAEGKTGNLNSQQGDAVMVATLTGKLKWDEVHAYVMTFDYLTKTAAVEVYGIQNGEKVNHTETHSI